MSCFETISADWAEFGGAVLTNINQARYGTFIRRAKRQKAKVSNLPLDQLVIKPRNADRSIYDEGRDCVLTDTQRGDVGQVVDWLTPRCGDVGQVVDWLTPRCGDVGQVVDWLTPRCGDVGQVVD
jgi:hypothetical protein